MKLRPPQRFDAFDRIIGVLSAVFLLLVGTALLLPPQIYVCSWKPHSLGPK
jgi:hypothetical protein